MHSCLNSKQKFVDEGMLKLFIFSVNRRCTLEALIAHYYDFHLMDNHETYPLLCTNYHGL